MVSIGEHAGGIILHNSFLALAFTTHSFLALAFTTHTIYATFIDIQGRYQALDCPCNGVVSHRVKTGGLWVFTDHNCKNKQKANVYLIFVHCGVFAYVHLHAQMSTSVDAGDINT